MAVFFVLSGIFSSVLFSLSSFDAEEKSDLSCDCVPFELLSPAKSETRRVPIERFSYTQDGELVVIEEAGIAC